MTTYGFLILFSWSLMLTDQNALALRADCELKATVEVERSTNNALESRAIINVNDRRGSYKYLFFDAETGRMLQRDFEKSSIDGLKKGSYYCVVVEVGGCTAKVHFEIQ